MIYFAEIWHRSFTYSYLPNRRLFFYNPLAYYFKKINPSIREIRVQNYFIDYSYFLFSLSILMFTDEFMFFAEQNLVFWNTKIPLDYVIRPFLIPYLSIS